MKRLFLFYMALFSALVATAQPRPFFVYADGKLAGMHYTADVQRIYFTPSDATINDQRDIQHIKTRLYNDSLPLAQIDSVSFFHPSDAQLFKTDGKVNPITQRAFRELIWDYKNHPDEFIYQGDKPAIVDFWATWCGPCKQMLPIMQQLAQEYAGRIDFYKVDTDKEIEVSNVMGVSSLPCFYFYPLKGKPAVRMGGMDLSSMREIIEKVLLITDDEDPNAEKPVLETHLHNGNADNEWTDRKVTGFVRCTSQNATLLKYGCFKQIEIENSGLSDREFVQQFGEVLPADQLSQVNSNEGLTFTFPAHKNERYRFICMAKTSEGGVGVSGSSAQTEASYSPVLDFQFHQGAIADQMPDPHKKYVTLYFKCNEAITVNYLCMSQSAYDQALSGGKTARSLLNEQGQTLTPNELSDANGVGFSTVIGGLDEMTDYVCMAIGHNSSGKTTLTVEPFRTSFDGYDDVIPYPSISLITAPYGPGFSVSFSCSTGDAIQARLLTLPSSELTQLLSQGETLEDIIQSHPSAGNLAGEQLEWINGQGISNVYTSVASDTRFASIAYVRGKFGGTTVSRSDVETIPSGAQAPALDVVLSISRSGDMLYGSAVCRSANATAATAVILESSILESKLAEGLTLEQVPNLPASEVLQKAVFTAEQVGWFNQSGFVMGCSGIRPHTRYTWVLKATNTAGKEVVVRTDYQTPVSGY